MICSAVCLVRFMVRSPAQSGRMRTLIQTGLISRVHVTGGVDRRAGHGVRHGAQQRPGGQGARCPADRHRTRVCGCRAVRRAPARADGGRAAQPAADGDPDAAPELSHRCPSGAGCGSAAEPGEERHRRVRTLEMSSITKWFSLRLRHKARSSEHPDFVPSLRLASNEDLHRWLGLCGPLSHESSGARWARGCWHGCTTTGD
jgi:hypothetical protein